MTGIVNANVQLGDSGTATQNFTLTVPAVPDGTMKLHRGNAGAGTQDIITVDAAGKVSLPAGNDMVGVGQTWQNLTGSRTLVGSYTNSTGKPIQVSVMCANAGNSGSTGFALVVAGITVGTTYILQQTGAGNYSTTLSAIVPAGAEYHVTGVASATLSTWAELR